MKIMVIATAAALSFSAGASSAGENQSGEGGLAARSRSNAVVSPVVGGAIHPGTAILDSMGIFAGVLTPTGGPVHRGTAILDAAGIFAGKPVAVPMADGTAQGAENAVTLK